MGNLVKVISNTGKIHLAYPDVKSVYPLCNYKSWRGNYFGQPWKVAKNQKTGVTCKNCIKAYAKIKEKKIALKMEKHKQLEIEFN